MKRTLVFLLWVVLLGNLIACTGETVSPEVFDSAAPEPTAAGMVETFMPTATHMPDPTETSPVISKVTPTASPTPYSVEEAAIEVVTVTAEPSGGAFVIGGKAEAEPTAAATMAPLAAGPFTLVSVSSEGEQGRGDALTPSVSADGRFIAFTGDYPGHDAVYVYDRDTGRTELTSITADGFPTRANSPSISADGRYVAFVSLSPKNLTGDPTNSRPIFVHDRETGETSLVSILDPESPKFDARGFADTCPSISADGQLVVFVSAASNLVTNPAINPGNWDNDTHVFIHNRSTQETQVVSVTPSGEPANDDSGCAVISADGRYVAFESMATDLTETLIPDSIRPRIYVRDLYTQHTVLVSQPSDGTRDGYAGNLLFSIE